MISPPPSQKNVSLSTGKHLSISLKNGSNNKNYNNNYNGKGKQFKKYKSYESENEESDKSRDIDYLDDDHSANNGKRYKISVTIDDGDDDDDGLSPADDDDDAENFSGYETELTMSQPVPNEFGILGES